MKRALLAAPILLAAALLASTPVAAVAKVSSAPDPLPPAAETLSQCLQTSGRLSALILVDESGSLVGTDPGNQRVAGIKAALGGLQQLSDIAIDGRKPVVEVLLAGFADTVDLDPGDPADPRGWQPVTSDTLDALLGQADAFAARNHGLHTDYGEALAEAEQLFAQRATEVTTSGGPAPCKALIWFTDGRYDIAGGAPALAAGVQVLCRPGGLMDRFVTDGVITFTVALTTQLHPPDSAFLDNLTTGGPTGTGCGSRRSTATGDYLRVEDSDELYFVFSQLFTGPVPHGPPVSICPAAACPQGTVSFQTVANLNRFVLQANTGISGGVIDLTTPAGDQLQLDPSGPVHQQGGSATVTQRWANPQTVELQGDFPGDATDWIGTWTAAFVDPSGRNDSATPRYTLQLNSDLAPALDTTPRLVAGERTAIHLHLLDPRGATVTSGPLAQSATLTATLNDPAAGTTAAVPLDGAAGGGFGGTITVPANTTATIVNLDVTASFALLDGVTVVPQQHRFQLHLTLPTGSPLPTVGPSRLQPPSITGHGATHSTLTVTASRLADGCVWISPPQFRAPPAATPIALTAADDPTTPGTCLTVTRGHSRRVALTFTPAKPSSGTITGTVPVHLQAHGVAGEKTIAILVTFETFRPPNVARRLWIFAALTLAGAALPVGYLIAATIVAATFTEPERLLALTLDVVFQPGEKLLDNAGEPVTAGFNQFQPVAVEGNGRWCRHLQIDTLTLRAVTGIRFTRRPLRLFTPAHALVQAANGRRVLAGGANPDLRPGGDGTHEVPLALPGTWILRVDSVQRPGRLAQPDAPPRVAGRLTLLIRDGRGAAQGATVLAAAQRGLAKHTWQPAGPPPTTPAGRTTTGLGAAPPRPADRAGQRR